MLNIKIFLSKNRFIILRGWLFLILFFYFLIGISLGIRNRPEKFPLFSWFLYDKVPNQVKIYKILIHEYEGKKYNPPLDLHKFRNLRENGTYLSINIPLKTHALINKLGESYVKKDPQKLLSYRHILENNILRGQTKYELVVERYEPIAKWDDNQYRFKSLAIFANY